MIQKAINHYRNSVVICYISAKLSEIICETLREFTFLLKSFPDNAGNQFLKQSIPALFPNKRNKFELLKLLFFVAVF